MYKTSKQLMQGHIVVAGAGLAGVAAAVAAARRGARVTLIEKENVPGGTARGLRHQFLCGLFLNSAALPRKYLNPGLTQEVCQRLSPRGKPVKMGKVWLWSYDPDKLSMTLHDLVSREKNIQVLYGSMITSCRLYKGGLESIRYFSRGKVNNLEASVFIDAGSGILLQQCSAVRSLAPGKRQMSGFAIELDRVLWDDIFSIRVPYALYRAVVQGELPVQARWTIASTCQQAGHVHLKLSFPEGMALALVKKTSMLVVKVLQRELPAFRSAKIAWQSQDLFSRNGDQLDGQYLLKDNDVLKGNKFSDGVVKGSWPMEYWDQKRGPMYKYCAQDHYEVPVRSLKARNVVNLFAAGRCVSAEPGAQASLRVGGLCLATGEAAGNAAVDYLHNT